MDLELPNGQPALDFSSIPRLPSLPREKPMEVLCLGLSRTGTMSTWVALRWLGLETYHCAECGRNQLNNDVFPKWREAIEAKYFNGSGKRLQTREDFDVLLWRYQAVTDIPCVLFADELVRAYPEAKVVLTERDVEGWVKSVQSSFGEILSWRVWYFLKLFDSHWTNNYLAIISSPLKIWTDGDPENVDKLREGFLAYNQHIRDIVPKERLLVWHPRDGWEPLCEFLHKPVPEQPLPRVNEGDFTAKIFQYLVFSRMVDVAKKLAKAAVPAMVAGTGWWWWYQRRL